MESQLRLLAQRLLSPIASGIDRFEPQFLVGELPEQLRARIPIPDGVHVIGSVVLDLSKIQVVLEAGQSPRQIFDFYRQAINSIGGREIKPSAPPHSSETTPSELESLVRFRLPDSKQLLVVMAASVEDGPTDVRLHLLGGQDAPAGSGTFNVVDSVAVLPLMAISIPSLKAPAKATDLATFHGLDTMGRFVTLALTAQESAQVLANHFEEQLERAGWSRGLQGVNGLMAWSTWTVGNGEIPVRGYFCVQEWPEAGNRRLVLIRIESLGV